MPSPELERRVTEARSGLDADADAVEWSSDRDEPLSETISTVLCIDSLPDSESDVVNVLGRWKRDLNVGAELRLIEQVRRTPSGITSVLRAHPDPYSRDVVAALRATGWVIAAIDRIDVRVNGAMQQWVDLRATDVRGQVAREPT
jgi:predicted fused transcriptional regulator/phosphomethylpyrimidine kinase